MNAHIIFGCSVGPGQGSRRVSLLALKEGTHHNGVGCGMKVTMRIAQEMEALLELSDRTVVPPCIILAIII